MRTVAGTAEVAPQRTHRFIEPLFNITLSKFQAFRFLMLVPSSELQLSLTHADTLAGGADQSHAPVPPLPAFAEPPFALLPPAPALPPFLPPVPALPPLLPPLPALPPAPLVPPVPALVPPEPLPLALAVPADPAAAAFALPPSAVVALPPVVVPEPALAALPPTLTVPPLPGELPLPASPTSSGVELAAEQPSQASDRIIEHARATPCMYLLRPEQIRSVPDQSNRARVIRQQPRPRWAENAQARPGSPNDRTPGAAWVKSDCTPGAVLEFDGDADDPGVGADIHAFVGAEGVELAAVPLAEDVAVVDAETDVSVARGLLVEDIEQEHAAEGVLGAVRDARAFDVAGVCGFAAVARPPQGGAHAEFRVGHERDAECAGPANPPRSPPCSESCGRTCRRTVCRWAPTCRRAGCTRRRGSRKRRSAASHHA